MILPPNQSNIPPTSPIQPVFLPKKEKVVEKNETVNFFEALPFNDLSSDEIEFIAETTHLNDELAKELESLLFQKESQVESHLKGLEAAHKDQKIVKAIVDVQKWANEYAFSTKDIVHEGMEFLENIIPASISHSLKGIMEYVEKITKVGGDLLGALDNGSLGLALIFKGKILRETKQALSLLIKEYKNREKDMKENLQKLRPEAHGPYKNAKLAELKELKNAIAQLKVKLKKETKEWKKDQYKFAKSTLKTSLMSLKHITLLMESAFVLGKHFSHVVSTTSNAIGFISSFSSAKSELSNYRRYNDWVAKFKKWKEKNNSGSIDNLQTPPLNPPALDDTQFEAYKIEFHQEIEDMHGGRKVVKDFLNKINHSIDENLTANEFKEKMALPENKPLRDLLISKYVLFREDSKLNALQQIYEEEFNEEIAKLQSIEEVREKLHEFGYDLEENLTLHEFRHRFESKAEFKKTIISAYIEYQEAFKAFDEAIANAKNLLTKREAIVDKKIFLLTPQIDSLLPAIKELKKKQFLSQIISVIKTNDDPSIIKEELRTVLPSINLDAELEGQPVEKDQLIKNLEKIARTRSKKDKSEEDFQETLKLVEDELLLLDPPLRLKGQIVVGKDKDEFQRQLIFSIHQTLTDPSLPPVLKSRGMIKEVKNWKTVEESLFFSPLLSEKFDQWFDSQNPQIESNPFRRDEKIKSLLTFYIDRQETIELTTKNALAQMIQKKQELESSLIKMKLVESSTFFTLSAIMLAVSSAMWILGVATLPFAGGGLLLLGLSIPPLVFTVAFYVAAVYLSSKRNPELSKEYAKGTSFKVLYANLRNAIVEYQHVSKQKKLLKTAEIVKAIRTQADLKRDDPLYEKAYRNYVQAKKEFMEGQEKVNKWYKKLDVLKEKLTAAAWKDYANHAKLTIGESEERYDTLEAFNNALREADLSLISPETKELLEVHMGLDLKKLQEKLAHDPKAIRNSLQKFFILDESEYINFMKHQELRLEAKLIKST